MDAVIERGVYRRGDVVAVYRIDNNDSGLDMLCRADEVGARFKIDPGMIRVYCPFENRVRHTPSTELIRRYSV